MCVAINVYGFWFRVWVSNFWFTPFWIEIEFLRLGLEFLISGLFFLGLWLEVIAFRVGVSNFGFITFWVWGSGPRVWGRVLQLTFCV